MLYFKPTTIVLTFPSYIIIPGVVKETDQGINYLRVRC